MQTKRIYMNEADGSPGNGAQPAAAVPAEQPAETAAPAPAGVTLDQVKGLMSEMLTGFKNSTFAELRKAGALKKDEPAAPAPSAAAPASTGLSMADVESLLERERVITRVATEHKLSDAQVKRMKGLLAAEKPDDVSSWASSFVTDMGFVRSNAEQPASATVPVVPNAAPISDRGSPAPNGAVGWRFELNNPIGMSATARAQMDAELGADKARRMRLEAAQAQASRMTVAINPRG